MSEPIIGKKIPNIDLILTGKRSGKLLDFSSDFLLLYFYPRANTPGCTQEGIDFSLAIADFNGLSCSILGASRDGIRAQENFKTKHGFAFELISDKDETLCHAFDVIKFKNMYGKQLLGVERSTFLVDAQGTLLQQWRKVKVKGHVEEVLEAVKGFSQ